MQEPSWWGTECTLLLPLQIQSVADAVLETSVQVQFFCRGNGRKQRTTPLLSDVKQVLRQWLDECLGNLSRPLFVSNCGGAFSRDGIERIVRKHANNAAKTCPSILGKWVIPHTLRRSATKNLLRDGTGYTFDFCGLDMNRLKLQNHLHADLAD